MSTVSYLLSSSGTPICCSQCASKGIISHAVHFDHPAYRDPRLPRDPLCHEDHSQRETIKDLYEKQLRDKYNKELQDEDVARAWQFFKKGYDVNTLQEYVRPREELAISRPTVQEILHYVPLGASVLNGKFRP